jgi:hypothetical protein
MLVHGWSKSGRLARKFLQYVDLDRSCYYAGDKGKTDITLISYHQAAPHQGRIWPDYIDPFESLRVNLTFCGKYEDEFDYFAFIYLFI